MPIYKQRNSATEVVGQERVEFHDAEQRLATESMVVHTGSGDVMCCAASSRFNYTDELVFQFAPECHEVGETGPAGQALFPSVRILFDRVESIDVVLDQLRKVKEGFIYEGRSDCFVCGAEATYTKVADGVTLECCNIDCPGDVHPDPQPIAETR